MEEKLLKFREKGPGELADKIEERLVENKARVEELKKILSEESIKEEPLEEMGGEAINDLRDAMFNIEKGLGADEADDSISPVALMRLTEIKDPDELLKDHNRDDIMVEEKLDGWKAQAIKKGGEVSIYSRRGEDKTKNFPDIVDALSGLPDGTLAEGELVYWHEGKQDVGKVTSLAGSKPETSLEKAKELPGTMKMHLYDILWHKGKNVSKESFSKRRQTLQSAVKTSEKIQLTKQYPFSDWQKAMNAAIKSGGEGIVLKIKDEEYQYKPKGQQEPKPKGIMYKYKGGVGKSDSDDYVVYDYEMSEKDKLKALFGQYHNGKLYHMSEISNFSKEDEATIKEKLQKGRFVIEIGFQERQPGGLRHQKFERFRDDKQPKDATMHEFHVKNIDEFKVADKKATLMISKRAAYADEWVKILERAVARLYPIGKLPQMPGVNFPAIYYLVSRLESNNRSDAVGDAGNSFGRTQVHGPYFMRYLANDPRTQSLTGMSPQELRQMAASWMRAKKAIRKVWKKVPVNQDMAKRYMLDKRLVLRRKEGVTIKRSPTSDPGIIKLKRDGFVGYVIDLDNLRSAGLNITDRVLSRLHQICRTFITPGVANSAISRLFIGQDNPVAYAKFNRTINSRNIRKSPGLQSVLDSISQKDFMNKVRIVVSDVKKYGYDTTAPGAYSIYQLIFTANGAGAGRVRQFLRDRKAFAAGNIHYIQSSRFKRAMRWIQRDPKMPPDVQQIAGSLLRGLPPGRGMAGFSAPYSRERVAFVLSKGADEFDEDVPRLEEEETKPGVTPEMINLHDEFLNRFRKHIEVDPEIRKIVFEKFKDDVRSEPIKNAMIKFLETGYITGDISRSIDNEIFRIYENDITQYIISHWDTIQEKKQQDETYDPFLDYMLDVWYIRIIYPKEQVPQTEVASSFVFSKRADYVAPSTLYFPGQYADAIKSGKRSMTIRPNDVPVRIEEVVRCMTYSGGHICDVKITAKNVMSVNRIGKAYGNHMAKSLVQKFGPKKRFVVIKFELVDSINAADDDEDEKKMSEVLIDKDKKLTRGQIKAHYSKPVIRKKIMSRIKDKPILVYIGTGTNEKILKRNHDNNEIVITNDDPKKDEDPNNYFYWVKRRVLSFHQVFGTKTNLGFIDLDIHGDFPLSKAKEYANAVSKSIKSKYNVGTTTFQSGGSGLHVEFKLGSEMSIDKLRGELKEMLTGLNEDWEGVTTGVVKGSGMRSDVSTLHNKGSIRVPGAFGESHGNVKKSVGSEQDTAENNYNSGGFGKLYTSEIEEPFPDPLMEVSPMQSQEPVSSYVGYNTVEDGSFALSKRDLVKDAAKKKKILMLVAKEDFYEPEYFIPRRIFTEKYGFDVSVTSSDNHAFGSQGTEIVATPMSGVDAAGYDSFFVVGGRGMIEFSKNKDAQKLLKSFVRQKKPIAMICHGPLLAAEAGAIKGREITGWPDIVGKIRRAKGTWTGMPLERDGSMFTAVGPDDAENLAFVLANFLNGQNTLVPAKDKLLDWKDASQVLNSIWKFAADLSKEEELRRLIEEQQEEMEEEKLEEISPEERELIQQRKRDEIIRRQQETERGELEKKRVELEKRREFPEPHEVEEAEKPSKAEKPKPLSFRDIVRMEEEEEEEEKEPVEEEGLETSKEFEQMHSSIREELSVVLEDIGDFGDDWGATEPEEDEEEDYESTMEKAPETIFGVKLEAPKDESGEVLDRWFKKGEIVMPEMSIEAKDLFTMKNMKNGASLTKLFQDPLAWEIIHREPQILQAWVLPAIVVGIGQRWFNNNGSRATLGTRKFKNVGRTPFGMFDEDDIALLKKGASIEDLPSAKKYIRMINQLVTKYANYYFSYGYRKSKRNPQGALPMSGYIYKALSRAMTKEIAEVKGYKEVRFPVCAVCKAKQKNEKMVLHSMAKVGDNPARWECETCKREYEKNDDIEIPAIDRELDIINNNISRSESKLSQHRVALEDVEDEAAKGRMRKKIDEESQKVASYRGSASVLNQKKETLAEAQRILGGQLSVPYWHAWCPNPTCPGRKVPLTAIDWNADIWKKDVEGELAAKLYKRFGIKRPNVQEADIESVEKPVGRKVSSAHIPPEWLLDIEFICPHDGVKFTLRDSKYKGHRNLGGFLWEPHRRIEWNTIQEGPPKPLAFQTIAVPMAGAEEKMDAKLSKILFIYLSLIGRTIFSREISGKEEEFKKWLSKQLAMHEKIRNIKVFRQKLREISLYETIKETSSIDPLSFVSWLTETSVSGKFVQDKEKDIGQENFILKTTRAQRMDEVYIPILQSWTDRMLAREDGFEHFDLAEILTNRKLDGLPSDGPGTFFIAKIEDGVLPPGAGKQQEGVFGFGCNLKLDMKFGEDPKHFVPEPRGKEGFEDKLWEEIELMGKLRTTRSVESGLEPRVLRILGMWPLSEEQVEDLKGQIKKDAAGRVIESPGLEKLDGVLHVERKSKLGQHALASQDKNMVGDIVGHDFHVATLERDETSLSVGDYVLVQALLMPGQYHWDPIDMVQKLRRNSDTSKNIFGRLGALMSAEVSETEDRRLLQEFVQDVKEYGDDPKEMEMIVEDLIDRFEVQRKKKTSSLLLSIREAKDPLSKYKKKREFKETPEPEGEVSNGNKHRFVIQRHKAKKAGEHFDLRLENDDGALSSWSIPKHKLPSGKEKLLAVKTEDHPVSYMKFKGEIPEGEYGAGNMEIHDSGAYDEVEWSRSKIIFKLKGKREKGTYKIFNTDGKNWMIMEHKEEKKDSFSLSARSSY
jgi:DNA ligase D-like protein (predicted 3'-phosphoesterase)